MAPKERPRCDKVFLDKVSNDVLNEFRDYMFNKEYISNSPSIFHNRDWVDVATLWDYLKAQSNSTEHAIITTSSSPSSPRLSPSGMPAISPRVKREPVDKIELSTRSGHSNSAKAVLIQVKLEPVHHDFIDLSGSSPPPDESVHTGLAQKGPQEVIEISDSSEDSKELGAESNGDEDLERNVDAESDDFNLGLGATSDFDELKMEASSDFEGPLKLDVTSDIDYYSSDGDSMNSILRTETVWLDEDVETIEVEQLKTGHISVTKRVKVRTVEYVEAVPTAWPIPYEPTAYVLDLSDLKYNLTDKNGRVLSVDAIIKDKDKDSWGGTSGRKDSSARVLNNILGPHEVVCVWACEYSDPELLHVTRRELDPDANNALIDAQYEARKDEATSPAKDAAIYFHVIHTLWKCQLKGPGPTISCDGGPVIKPLNQPRNRERYFIGCDKWTRDGRGHEAHGIPDRIDQDILLSLFMTGHVSASKMYDTKLCPHIISSRIAFPHIIDGKAVQGEMCKHVCRAYRTIYVPENESMRMAVIVHNPKEPHNHPLPMDSKLSHESKKLYTELIMAAGVWGATTQKVDNATSTRLRLKGMNSGLIDNALMDRRRKKDLIKKVKAEHAPHGLGFIGVCNLDNQEKRLPINQCYVHGVCSHGDQRMVFTFDTFLLSLIHEVTSFEVDHTFKHVLEFNEWEIVVFSPAVTRAITIGRIYTNAQDRPFYKQLFDVLQDTVQLVTSKPMRFKRLTPGGNFLCMNADLEAAQALGFGDSFLSTNVPEHSGIPVMIDTKTFLSYILKSCHTHAKRALLDFQNLVSERQYNKLMGFVTLEKEDLPAFDNFIESLKKPKITRWWVHKRQSVWILPTILQSLSLMHSDDWRTMPSTTNTGEAQHHWTNCRTGVKLPLLEAIKIAQEVDELVSLEVRTTRKTSVTISRSNGHKHCITQSIKRAANTAKKAYKRRTEEEETSILLQEMAEITNTRKDQDERMRVLKVQLRDAKGTAQNPKKPRETAIHDDSSGRVKTPKPYRKAARATAAPYQVEGVAMHNDSSDLVVVPPSSSQPLSQIDPVISTYNLSQPIHQPTPETTYRSMMHQDTQAALVLQSPIQCHQPAPEAAHPPMFMVAVYKDAQDAQVASPTIEPPISMVEHSTYTPAEANPVIESSVTTVEHPMYTPTRASSTTHMSASQARSTSATCVPHVPELPLTWDFDMSDAVFDSFFAQYPSPGQS
ncbi:hypothetical protein BDQ17DRAFT_1419266 [Cyathus striatus]|nr:hypothetical protein BDQ17DRAFT_1419266 [Cyathus striatus]